MSVIPVLARSYRLHLAAANASPATTKTYLAALGALQRFLEGEGLSTDVAGLRRAHLEGFLAARSGQVKATTLSIEYRALRSFFRWAVEEEELAASPLAKIKAPIVPVQPPAVLSDQEIKRLIAACAGKGFQARRDMAIMRLFLDTGMRRSELAYLKVEDVDLASQLAKVTGKFRRVRMVPFGARTAQAIDRYLRLRAEHRYASDAALWLGQSGPLTDNGCYQAVREVGKRAGLPDLFCHQMRHTLAHRWLASGGQEGDLMQIAGWHSRTMLNRYGASAAAERSWSAYRRLSLGDTF